MIVLIALSPLRVYAHGFDFVKADLAIDNNEMGFSEYRLTFTTSLVYMSELILAIKDADVDVLPELAKLSSQELEDFSQNILELFSQTQIFLDEKLVEKNRFYGLSGYSINNLLHENRGNVDPYLTFHTTGIISRRMDNISIQFPEELGDVELHIIRPQRPNLLAGERSKLLPINELDYFSVSVMKIANIMHTGVKTALANVILPLIFLGFGLLKNKPLSKIILSMFSGYLLGVMLSNFANITLHSTNILYSLLIFGGLLAYFNHVRNKFMQEVIVFLVPLLAALYLSHSAYLQDNFISQSRLIGYYSAPLCALLILTTLSFYSSARYDKQKALQLSSDLN